MLFLTFLAMITAIHAAVLRLSSVKRGRPIFRPLECEGPLPPRIGFLREYASLLDMCSSLDGSPAVNLQCECDGPRMRCGATNIGVLFFALNYCFAHCNCGPDTEKDRENTTTELNEAVLPELSAILNPPVTPAQHHRCGGSCTSVSRGCEWAFTGDCACHAPPVSAYFWFKGGCETRFVNPTSGGHGKRELPPPARLDNKNHVDHSSNSTTSARQKQTSLLVDQSAHRNTPAPCNESYVSYACHDSVDGIVHEPPENWLGALLPEEATEIPPVPRLWRKIHGFEDEKDNQKVEVDVAREDK